MKGVKTKLLVVATFTLLAVSAFADEENWEIDWSTVIPRTQAPGYVLLIIELNINLMFLAFYELSFWDNRLLKPASAPSRQRIGRIVGGVIVQPNSHPYQVGLLQRVNILITTLCGGSLLTTRSVLTAAHCPENTQSTQAILGAHVLNANEPNQQRQTIQATGYRFHPQYNTQTLENDIAILILPSAATLNAVV